MSLEKLAFIQEGIWKEKVEGLTLKIFKSVREHHTFFIPHVVKIIIQADTPHRKRKGYMTLFNSPILREMLSIFFIITDIMVLLYGFFRTYQSTLVGKIDNPFAQGRK